MSLISMHPVQNKNKKYIVNQAGTTWKVVIVKVNKLTHMMISDWLTL